MPEPSGPRTIAVINQKGGVGKTTTTVNLGAAFADAGHRVCLIDLDPQAHATLHLGLDPDRTARTVYDLLVGPGCEAVHCRVAARKYLDVIPSVVDLAAAESELADHPTRQRILADKLAGFLDDYEFVLLDCPPSLGILTLNALALAREVLVPMQAHFLALQGVGKLLQTVELVAAQVNPELRVTGIVLCMHEAQTTLAKEVVADLDAFFAETGDVPWHGCRVLEPYIRRNIKLAEAPSFGKTIFDYAHTCAGANDYRKLARTIMGPDDTAARPEPPVVETKPMSAEPAAADRDA